MALTRPTFGGSHQPPCSSRREPRRTPQPLPARPHAAAPVCRIPRGTALPPGQVRGLWAAKLPRHTGRLRRRRPAWRPARRPAPPDHLLACPHPAPAPHDAFLKRRRRAPRPLSPARGGREEMAAPRAGPRMAHLYSAGGWFGVTDVNGSAPPVRARRFRRAGSARLPPRPSGPRRHPPESPPDSPMATPTAICGGYV